MANEDALGWAKDLAGRHAVVMHLPTKTVGAVRKLYDGMGELYVSPLNDDPVRGAVLELEPGHTFEAKPDAFIELEPREVEFYAAVEATIGEALRAMAAVGATKHVRPHTMAILATQALRAQANRLELQSQAALRNEALRAERAGGKKPAA